MSKKKRNQWKRKERNYRKMICLQIDLLCDNRTNVRSWSKKVISTRGKYRLIEKMNRRIWMVTKGNRVLSVYWSKSNNKMNAYNISVENHHHRIDRVCRSLISIYTDVNVPFFSVRNISQSRLFVSNFIVYH